MIAPIHPKDPSIKKLEEVASDFLNLKNQSAQTAQWLIALIYQHGGGVMIDPICLAKAQSSSLMVKRDEQGNFVLKAVDTKDIPNQNLKAG